MTAKKLNLLTKINAVYEIIKIDPDTVWPSVSPQSTRPNDIYYRTVLGCECECQLILNYFSCGKRKFDMYILLNFFIIHSLYKLENHLLIKIIFNNNFQFSVIFFKVDDVDRGINEYLNIIINLPLLNLM